jgi:hypothetical protein
VLSSDELWEWLLSTGGKQAGKQARVLNELPCETLLNIPLRVIMNRRSAIEVSLIEISEDGTNEKRISRAFDLKKRVKFLELKTPALPGLEGVLSLLLFLRDSIETNLLSMRKLIIEYHQRHIRMERNSAPNIRHFLTQCKLFRKYFKIFIYCIYFQRIKFREYRAFPSLFLFWAINFDV